MPSTVLSGTTAGVGSSVFVGEFGPCPGRDYEFAYAIKLQNTGDTDINIDSITYEAGLVPGYVIVPNLDFPWVDPGDRTIPNTPAEGCNGMRLCPSCWSELDDWEISGDEVANIITGLIGNEDGFPEISVNYAHTFSGGTPPQTWNTGGLILGPDEFLIVFSMDQMTVDFNIEIETPPIEFDINGTINILGSMEVTYVPEEITFDVSGAIEIFGSMVATVDNHVTPCFSFPTNSFIITDESALNVTLTNNDCGNDTEYEDEESALVATSDPCPPPRCN